MFYFRPTNTISEIHGRQILDSRGRPTVEVVVSLSDGSHGTVSVPSGASVGKNEALEMRDKRRKEFCSYGVTNAVNNVNTLIAEALVGITMLSQKRDRRRVDVSRWDKQHVKARCKMQL